MALPPVAITDVGDVMRPSCRKPRSGASMRSGSTKRNTVMADYPFTQEDLDVLAQWDTPTICNGLEVVVPERRAFGYTVEPMICIDPKAKPIVGVARVG